MRVNLSSLYAGPRGSWGPGVCDLPADIGKELIEAGVAIPINMETRDAAPSVEEAPAAEEKQATEEAPVRRGSRRGSAGKPED